MKRLFLIALLILMAGGSLGLMMARDPGYVLIAWHQTSIEMSLWLALMLMLCGIVLGSVAMGLLGVLLTLGQRLRDFLQRRRERRGLNRLAEGYRLLLEGRYRSAERHLLVAALHSPAPLSAWLAAAEAAQHRQDISRRDDYLRQAELHVPEARSAIQMRRAELLQTSGQWEQAALVLDDLLQQNSRHRRALALLSQLYVEHDRHDRLSALMPQLLALRLRGDATLATAQRNATLALMRDIASRRRVMYDNSEQWQGAITQLWSKLPRAVRRDSLMLAGYCRELMRTGAQTLAEQLLRAPLKKSLEPALLDMYGRVRADEPVKQLAFAEQLLRNASERNPHLLCMLARVCQQNRQWLRARQFFEAAFELDQAPTTAAELVRLCTSMGEHHKAQHYVIQGLSSLASDLPDLPLP